MCTTVHMKANFKIRCSPDKLERTLLVWRYLLNHAYSLAVQLLQQIHLLLQRVVPFGPGEQLLDVVQAEVGCRCMRETAVRRWPEGLHRDAEVALDVSFEQHGAESRLVVEEVAPNEQGSLARREGEQAIFLLARDLRGRRCQARVPEQKRGPRLDERLPMPCPALLDVHAVLPLHEGTLGQAARCCFQQGLLEEELCSGLLSGARHADDSRSGCTQGSKAFRAHGIADVVQGHHQSALPRVLRRLEVRFGRGLRRVEVRFGRVRKLLRRRRLIRS